ncbi:hypothetical protein [Amycolatopsis sp. H20-H5]|uniref:hypothetical protein n=1 Tax=Amycolatopsis sp. H20-H5 TaxID=3046309 RepID=UPI002DBDF040|nr:hypothetical protein [Amycolatopsis sp. H20-H5]MEC3978164.1 hypothetical protein [Amycolatopsis sp. H20-H5]
MSDNASPAGLAAASEQLRRLLGSDLDYRRRWLVHAQRMRTTEINYAAVSQVVALYLWDQGLKSDTDTDLPRKLRDRIRQALRGELLTYETLTWITQAFGFAREDASQVWDAFAGKSATDLDGDGIAFTLRTPPIPLIKPQQLQTTALFARYYVNRNRALAKIETSHIVVALEDGVDTYAYSPRATASEVDVIAGGKFVRFHDSAPGFTGVEIKLDRPLRKGQQTSLQYSTLHNESKKPCTHLRRATRKRMENIDMRVIFEDVYPVKAWWSTWDAYDEGNIVSDVPAKLENGSELHQFISYAEQAVAGFRWDW